MGYPAQWFNRGAIAAVCVPIFILGVYFQVLGARTAVGATISTRSRGSVSAAVRFYSGDSKFSSGVLLVYDYHGRRFRTPVATHGWPPRAPDGANEAEWDRSVETGQPITVYVDPQNPSDFAVDPRPTLTSELTMLVAAPFTLLGLLGILSERRQKWVNVELFGGLWGVFVLAIFGAGHALGLATTLALALYFLVIYGLYRFIRTSNFTTIEEDLDAPEMDIADFRP